MYIVGRNDGFMMGNQDLNFKYFKCQQTFLMVRHCDLFIVELFEFLYKFVE